MADNVYEAVNEVMHEVGYVQKERAAGLSYTFASEAALIEALRPSMVEHGVMLHPLDVEMLTAETYENSRGTTLNRVVGRFAFRFIHAASETWFDVQVLGEGIDAGDKAANKAMTGALKYALRQTFVIETGDDPDRYSSDDQQRGNGASNGNGHAPIEPQKYMADLSSQEVTWLYSHGWQLLGCSHPKHFKNRLMDRTGCENVHDIGGTFGEFWDLMLTA